MRRREIQEMRFDGVSFGYEEDQLIFDDLSFSFTMNHPVILQGQTGGGKSTLLKLLLGLMPVSRGRYLINKEEVQGQSFKSFDGFRLNMGHSFDSGGLINNRSLYENFILPIDYHGFKPNVPVRDYIIGFMERFHIEELKHLRPAFVSSGVRKACILMRAFLLDPQVLILNNPTLGLNPEHLNTLVELIVEHQRKRNLKYLIVSSDDPRLIEKLGGQIYQVTKNEIIPPYNIIGRAA